MKDSILGIDPGKTGGFVLLSPGGSIIRKAVTPLTSEGEIDLDRLGRMFYEMSDLIRVAYLEKVGSNPMRGRKQGTTSMFNFGRTCGILIGHLSAFRIPFEQVRPQEWQKPFHLGIISDDPKVRSKMAVLNVFPKTDFRATSRSTTPHEGLVDAALIAEFGRRIVMGLG